MKYKNCIFIIMAAVLLCFTSCGKEQAVLTRPAQQEQMTKLETEELTVLVPNGWGGYECADFSEDEENSTDPSAVVLYKGSTSETDVSSCPGIKIRLNNNGNSIEPDQEEFAAQYSDFQQKEDVELSGRTWHQCQMTSDDLPIILLWTEDSPRLLLWIWPQGVNGSISLEDEDVKSIVQSIQVK